MLQVRDADIGRTYRQGRTAAARPRRHRPKSAHQAPGRTLPDLRRVLPGTRRLLLSAQHQGHRHRPVELHAPALRRRNRTGKDQASRRPAPGALRDEYDLPEQPQISRFPPGRHRIRPERRRSETGHRSATPDGSGRCSEPIDRRAPMGIEESEADESAELSRRQRSHRSNAEDQSKHAPHRQDVRRRGTERRLGAASEAGRHRDRPTSQPQATKVRSRQRRGARVPLSRRERPHLTARSASRHSSALIDDGGIDDGDRVSVDGGTVATPDELKGSRPAWTRVRAESRRPMTRSIGRPRRPRRRRA